MIILKQIISILLFVIILNQFSFSQTTHFAVIVDPQIGLQDSEGKLLSAIENINSRNDLDFVIVFGNISSDGSYSKLNSANNLLQELKIPYYVAPGINEVSLAANGGIDYSQSIGGDGFSFNLANKMFLSINSFIPYNPYLKRINIDESKWIKDFIASSDFKSLILFSSVSPPEMQNRDELNGILSKVDNALMFIVDENQYEREKFENLDIIKLPVVTGKDLFYNSIKFNDDTVYVFKSLLAEMSDLLIDSFKLQPLDIRAIDKKDVLIHSGQVKINHVISFYETHLAKPLFSESLIYTASKTGTINATDEFGNQKWQYYAGGTMFHSPARYKDILAAVIFESDLITLNANNGDVLQIIGLSENINGPPSLIDIRHNGYDTKGIIVTTVTGAIYCYELFSLELVWSQKTMKGRISSAPLSEKNMVIFCNRKGEVFALNSDNGTLVWKTRLGKNDVPHLNFTSPLTDGKNVYVLLDHNILAAIDLLQGTLRWTNNNIPHQHTFIMDVNGQILVKGNDKNYMLVSSSDGKLISTFPSFSNTYFPGNFVKTEKFILNGTSEGDVVMIDPNLNVTVLFNSFNAPVVSVTTLDSDSFVSLDMNGNLIFFELIEMKE